jgi:hypothetical protein
MIYTMQSLQPNCLRALSKGTIVLMLPLLLYLFITDIVRKRDLKFWIYSAVTGFIFVFAYLFQRKGLRYFKLELIVMIDA